MKKTFTFLILLFFFLVLPKTADAAFVYLEPSSGSHNIGDTFEVAVWVDPEGEDVQTMDLIMTYDKTKLETSQNAIEDEKYFGNYTDYVFNVDQTEGSMKNFIFATNGAITNDQKAKVITITFTAKAAGTATVNFLCGNDFQTQVRNKDADLIVCGSNGSGSYTIASSGSVPTSTPAPTSVPQSTTTPQPTLVPTSQPVGGATTTPSALPETGFISAGWGAISLASLLIGIGLLFVIL
jgi:hypothetical protein